VMDWMPGEVNDTMARSMPVLSISLSVHLRQEG
jgi:hypothetical protein